MNLNFTDRARLAGIITRQEAEEIEAWIDEAVEEGGGNCPEHLEELFGKVHLFNFSSKAH